MTEKSVTRKWEKISNQKVTQQLSNEQRKHWTLTLREKEWIPEEDIKRNSGACVTEMAVVVGSDTADVHGNLAVGFGLEDLLLLSHGIVNPQLSLLLRHDHSTPVRPNSASIWCFSIPFSPFTQSHWRAWLPCYSPRVLSKTSVTYV